jgi:uncharacterized protein (DUF362 family)
MKHPECTWTRREVLVGATGSAILSGCSNLGRSTAAPRVSIVRAAGYTQDLYDVVRRILLEHAVEVRGRNVVLKPNLVEFEPNGCINTNPLLVHAVFEAVTTLGAKSVRIAEGPGHRRNTLDLADDAGYFKTVPHFEDLFTDLNLDEVRRMKIPHPFSRLDSLYLPQTILGADLLISLPKMKTHHWVGATLSMKNLFGVVPGGVYGWPKNVLHWAGIPECIADLHSMFPRTFCIVDGIVGMQGNGPIQGDPKAAGLLVAGHDMPAVDATCCRVMGIDPLHIEYLRLAASRGSQIEATQIVQTGERVDAAATPFELLPAFSSFRLAKRT